MSRKREWLLGRVALAACVVSGVGGCTFVDLLINNTSELEGNVELLFVNNTSSRAIFGFGTWNPLDRPLEPTVNYRTLRLGEGQTSNTFTLPCARTTAIATPELVAWVLGTEVPDEPDFEPQLLNAEVFFSDEPTDSDNADAPTAGRANGLELLVGLHYSCGDRIIVTFNADPDAPGGFRIDYEVISDVNPDIP